MNKAEKVLKGLVAHLNLKNYRELADYLGVKTSTLYGCIRNKNIADAGCILAKVQRINIGWIKTGEGPMLKYEPQPGDSIKLSFGRPPQSVSPKIAARIEPGNHRVTDCIPEMDARENDQLTDSEVDEMLKMTASVLKSNTVYRSALASNVRAFHQAVHDEVEMNSMREEMEKTNKRLESIESLLLEMMGGQKREAGN